MTIEFTGILPAIASPCDANDAFLPDAFAALAQRLYADGVHGLYVCGATGDGYKMRLAERKQATEVAVRVSAEYDGIVMVHVGSPSNTRDAVELAGHAARAGAAAVASIPPALCSHRQLVAYYTDIARASELPVFVYHIPLLTGAGATVDEMLELLDIPGVVGLKLTDWNLFFMKRLLLARPEIRVFSGFDEFLTPGLLYGAHGGIGMWYNLFPKLYLGIYHAVTAGDVARAMDLQNRLLAFCDLVWTYGANGVLEFLMQKRGLARRIYRRPWPELDADTKRKIEPLIDDRIARIEDVLEPI